MGSAAKKIQQQHFETRERAQTSIIRKVKQKISFGEMLLLCILAVGITFLGVKIVSNQAAIYAANEEIVQMEGKIEKQSKVNGDLMVQVKEKSSYERIYKKAEELGLTFTDNNVKGVQK